MRGHLFVARVQCLCIRMHSSTNRCSLSFGASFPAGERREQLHRVIVRHASRQHDKLYGRGVLFVLLLTAGDSRCFQQQFMFETSATTPADALMFIADRSEHQSNSMRDQSASFVAFQVSCNGQFKSVSHSCCVFSRSPPQETSSFRVRILGRAMTLACVSTRDTIERDSDRIRSSVLSHC